MAAEQGRNTKMTSMRFDAELLEQARDAAWRERMSLRAYLERALRTYVEEHPPPPPPTGD